VPNVVVIGFPRSGAGALARTLGDAGFHLPEEQVLPCLISPLATGEGGASQRLNEALLALCGLEDDDPGDGCRWLRAPVRPVPSSWPASLAQQAQRALPTEPFVFYDRRLIWTLTPWRPLLGDRRYVCVFRDPLDTALSLVEASDRHHQRPMRVETALAEWSCAYRRVLDEVADADWLFLHMDQLASKEGCSRLSAFVGESVPGTDLDERWRRARPDIEVPSDVADIYGRLCARAEFQPSPKMETESPPSVGVLVTVRDDDQHALLRCIADIEAQRGVRPEILIIDATRSGRVRSRGHRVLRQAPGGRVDTLREAGEALASPYVTFVDPNCRWLPIRLLAGVERLIADPACTSTLCDLYHHGPDGTFVQRSYPVHMGSEPPPYFESCLTVRRDRLRDGRWGEHVERRWLCDDRRSGTVAYLEEPLASVGRQDFLDGWVSSRDAAARAALGTRRGPLLPELSILLTTGESLRDLQRTLNGFMDQLVEPGTFELIVADRGTCGQTTAWLRDVKAVLPVQVVDGVGSTVAGGWHVAMGVARGRIALLCENGMVAPPDLVERHLRAHASLSAGAVVVQSPAVLAPALARTVFGRWRATRAGRATSEVIVAPFGAELGAWSVPTAVLRATGGWNPLLRDPSTALAELGAHLRRRGVAALTHVPVVDDRTVDLPTLASRAIDRAHDRITLAARDPSRASAIGEAVTDDIAQQLQQTWEDFTSLECAIAQIAFVDGEALELSGGMFADLSQTLVDRFDGWWRGITAWWARRGTLRGLVEIGVRGSDELVGGAAAGLLGTKDSGREVVAWPDWRRPDSLDSCVALVGALPPSVRIRLLFDANKDGDRDTALQALVDRVEASGLSTHDLVFEEGDLTPAELRRYARGAQAILVTGAEDPAVLRILVAERLTTPEQVSAWARRYTPPDLPPSARSRFSGRIEVSVIVPTHNRPRELVQLMEALAQQDLAFNRFEVLVVDDGSTPPASDVIGGREWPFAFELLRQAPTGPAAARNRALARARGDIIVFLNDDAVPGPSLIRHHLEAQRRREGPVAYVGPFTLVDACRQDSIGWHVHTTTVLFPQPAMHDGARYQGLAFCTGNLSVPKEVIERAGGFDETLPFAGGEDTELGLRLHRDQGLEVVYEPTLICGHDHHLSLEGIVRRYHVLGWMVYLLQPRFPDAELLAGWPFSDEDWATIRRDHDDNAHRFREMCGRIASIIAQERSQGRGPIVREGIRDIMEFIQRYSQFEGVLLALDGITPTEHWETFDLGLSDRVR
jgi:GT2 family glycosyltransferase